MMAPAGLDTEPSPMLCELPFLAPVEVTGADALTFLHGQFTSDVMGLAPGGVQFSAWCDARGRVVTTLLLARMPQRLVLFLPAALCSAFVERIQRFRLRAAVEFRDRSSDWTCIGLAGAGPDTDDFPPPGRVSELDDLVRVSLPGISPARTVVTGEPGLVTELYQSLEAHLPPAPSDNWRARDDADGIAWLNTEASGEYLPQELGLDRLGGLSYSKGCYPGQEIIARVRYRGQVKRGLALVALDAEVPPGPGTALSAGATRKGHLLEAHSGAEITGLAVLDMGCDTGAVLEIGDSAGRARVLARSREQSD